jgi:hypothetical protein
MLTSHCAALHLTGLRSSHCRRPSGSPDFYMNFRKVLQGKQHQVVNLLDDGWGNVFVLKATSDKALATMPQHVRDLLQQSVRCSPRPHSVMAKIHQLKLFATSCSYQQLLNSPRIAAGCHLGPQH